MHSLPFIFTKELHITGAFIETYGVINKVNKNVLHRMRPKCEKSLIEGMIEAFVLSFSDQTFPFMRKLN